MKNPLWCTCKAQMVIDQRTEDHPKPSQSKPGILKKNNDNCLELELIVKVFGLEAPACFQDPISTVLRIKLPTKY